MPSVKFAKFKLTNLTKPTANLPINFKFDPNSSNTQNRAAVNLKLLNLRQPYPSRLKSTLKPKIISR